MSHRKAEEVQHADGLQGTHRRTGEFFVAVQHRALRPAATPCGEHTQGWPTTTGASKVRQSMWLTPSLWYETAALPEEHAKQSSHPTGKLSTQTCPEGGPLSKRHACVCAAAERSQAVCQDTCRQHPVHPATATCVRAAAARVLQCVPHTFWYF